MAALYFALPDPPRFLWTMIGVSGVVAMVVGTVRNRPRHRLPWLLVAAGVSCLIAGDTTYDLLTGPLGMDNPFPSVADGIYLAMYPLIAGGLILMVRARTAETDREALLDALIVTLGLGTLSWVFLAQPYVADSTLSVTEKGFSIAYPLGDLLLLAVLARLLIGAGARPRSLALITAGSVGLLCSDVLYGWIQLNGDWKTGGPVDVGWLVFYGALGAAALEPDMVRLAVPEARASQVMSRGRLLLLGSASLVAPILLLWEALAGRHENIIMIAVVSGTLFVLVTVRLNGLVSRARQSTQRERVLRQSGEALVGASHREEIYGVGAQAVLDLIDGEDDYRVLVAIEQGEQLRLVHDTDPVGGVVLGGPMHDVVSLHGDELRATQFAITDSGSCGDIVLGRLGPDVPVLVAAMLRGEHVAGLVLVCGRDVDRSDVIDAVCAMTSQVLLAIDSADLTEQVLQRRNEAHFRSLIQNASDIILVVDASLSVVYQTPSVQVLLGRPADEVLGAPLLDLLTARDVPRAGLLLRRVLAAAGRGQHVGDANDEWHLRDTNGADRAFEVTCSNLLDDQAVRGLVLTLHDVTERRALEDELKHLAFHDSLTKLPNRALFLDRIEHALSRQGRHRERLAVMLVDLDDFKLVNDTRGHAAGDLLLTEVARRLDETVRTSDTCARLGGDEFAILVEGLLEDSEAAQLADRLLAELRLPFRLDGEEVSVSASIGVSTSDYGQDGAELLRQADLAMYSAKDSGKSRFDFYRPSLQDVMQARLIQRRDLERALAGDQFVLHYQPILDLESGRVIAAEALVRWQHPERGLVLPGEFIDAVEESDIAVPLGQWVLEKSIEQCALWQEFADGDEPFRISVNVAPRQLRDPAFVAVVSESLALHGLPPEALILEITERLIVGQDPQINFATSMLKGLGVRLAVDDFGTGYSALGYLRRFPVGSLKIDRSFVDGLEDSADDRALVEAIVSLGRTFGLGLVAEGIETEGQREALLRLGCNQGQGFLYSPGLPADEATSYFRSHTGLVPVPMSAPSHHRHFTPGEQVS